MKSRAFAAAAAVTVVLGAVQAIVIDRVDAGWPWRVAAVGVTIVLAALTAWMVTRNHGGEHPSRMGPGSVSARGKVTGGIRTKVSGALSTAATPEGVGPGAVQASGRVDDGIATNVQD